jgi:ribosomal protein L9
MRCSFCGDTVFGHSCLAAPCGHLVHVQCAEAIAGAIPCPSCGKLCEKSSLWSIYGFSEVPEGAAAPRTHRRAWLLYEGLRCREVALTQTLAELEAAVASCRAERERLSAEASELESQVSEKQARFKAAVNRKDDMAASIEAATIFRRLQRGGGEVDVSFAQMQRHPSSQLLVSLGALMAQQLTTMQVEYASEMRTLGALQEQAQQLRSLQAGRARRMALESGATEILGKPAPSAPLGSTPGAGAALGLPTDWRPTERTPLGRLPSRFEVPSSRGTASATRNAERSGSFIRGYSLAKPPAVAPTAGARKAGCTVTSTAIPGASILSRNTPSMGSMILNPGRVASSEACEVPWSHPIVCEGKRRREVAASAAGSSRAVKKVGGAPARATVPMLKLQSFFGPAASRSGS